MSGEHRLRLINTTREYTLMRLFEGKEYKMRERVLALRKKEARKPELPLIYHWVRSFDYQTTLAGYPDYAVLSYSRDRSSMLIQHVTLAPTIVQNFSILSSLYCLRLTVNQTTQIDFDFHR